MDPIACLSELIRFLAQEEWQEVNIRAEALDNWLSSGNFFPDIPNLLRSDVEELSEWALAFSFERLRETGEI